MLYMSCTLLFTVLSKASNASIALYRVSAHTSSCGSRLLPSLVVAQTFESTTVGIMDS